MTRLLFLTCALNALWVSGAAAQFPPANPVLNPDSGHYYQLVINRPQDRFSLPRPLLFEDALSRAASTMHLGIPGHLVTITSQAEQDFLENAFESRYTQNWLWIGASDAAREGEWRWVAGPEAGQLFWLGDEKGTALGFHSWGFGPGQEPNNDAAGNRLDPSENYAALRLPIRPNWGTAWNDVANPSTFGYAPEGYIVEYSPIPEPAVNVLIAMACLTGVYRARGR